ncbi:MAG: hypothetical protein JJ891_06685 [Rhizobiaceae bacterium]|jgi:hypothetical protein|nr:hypothetical protein [Rhizobiaceae bacterium]
MRIGKLLATTSLGLLMINSTPAMAKRLAVFVFDISDSVPITVKSKIARYAGSTVANVVSDMEPGDTVRLRSLGLAGAAARQIKVDVKLGRKARSRPDRIGPVLGQIVASIPQRVERGDLQIQTETNIVGFLEALESSLDCDNVETRIVLFTDAIEWTSYFSGQEFLDGKIKLPEPSGPILKGCHVEMRGMGQLSPKFKTDSRWFPYLKTQWRVFFDAAGVISFTPRAEF